MSAGSHPAPWLVPSAPPVSAPPPDPTAAAPPHTPPALPHFSSSWGAFNLPQPRAQPSNLTLALERGFGSASAPLPASASSTLGHHGLAPPASSFGPHAGQQGAVPGARRMSALGADIPMTMTWEDEASGSGSGAAAASIAGDDMMSMSPGGGGGGGVDPPHAQFQSASMFRSTRSRSGSASSALLLNPGGGSSSGGPSSALAPQLFPFTAIPPSPVTVARALQQGGQKTPPPFLQRRLFKEEAGNGGGGGGSAPEETASVSGRSSRSGSSSDVGMSSVGTKTRAMRIAARTNAVAAGEEDDEIEELSAVLSRSASAGPEDPMERGVVRRPVSRKPNLLPKPKSHLRILSELRSESSGDQEIVSEATLHRLSRAGASAVPALRSSCPPSCDPSAPANSASSLSARVAHPVRPTPNRFPEQATEEEDLLSHRMGGGSSSSSNDEADEAIEVGSDWGAMSVGGYATEDEEERRSNVVWNGIRSGPGGNAVTVATPSSAGMAKSPHGDRRLLDFENPFAAPQTPSATYATRPGKRKMGDDRFEPYAHQAFKRRAVSPAASLSLSPGFANAASHASTSASTSSRPTPPPLPMSSLGTQPVAIPSPSSAGSHHHFFSSVSGSAVMPPGAAAGSRSAASSLSSSTGRGFSAFSMSERHRSLSAVEERERALAMKMDPDGLGRMSLEGGPASASALDEEEEEL